MALINGLCSGCSGVIESRSSGMKGTYIKVLNEVIFDELEEIKAQRNKKA